MIKGDWATDDNPNSRRRVRGYDYIRSGLMGQAVGLLCVFDVWQPFHGAFWLGATCVVLGAACIVAGCGKLAWHKGHSKAWALLGLFSLLGVLVLMCFREQGSDVPNKRGFEVVVPQRVSSVWVGDKEGDRPRGASQPVNYWKLIADDK